MSRTITVSETFYEYLTDQQEDEESIEATLWRMIGGPDPAAVAGILSEETAADMRNLLDEK